MWFSINPVAQHSTITANIHHRHKMQDDLLIQHSLLGDPSSYLLLYSCGHKPSEGCKTSQNPLCRLAKIQPNRTFQRKEESSNRAQREEKRHVSQTLIRRRTGGKKGMKSSHACSQMKHLTSTDLVQTLPNTDTSKNWLEFIQQLNLESANSIHSLIHLFIYLLLFF